LSQLAWLIHSFEEDRYQVLGDRVEWLEGRNRFMEQSLLELAQKAREAWRQSGWPAKDVHERVTALVEGCRGLMYWAAIRGDWAALSDALLAPLRDVQAMGSGIESAESRLSSPPATCLVAKTQPMSDTSPALEEIRRSLIAEESRRDEAHKARTAYEQADTRLRHACREMVETRRPAAGCGDKTPDLRPHGKPIAEALAQVCAALRVMGAADRWGSVDHEATRRRYQQIEPNIHLAHLQYARATDLVNSGLCGNDLTEQVQEALTDPLLVDTIGWTSVLLHGLAGDQLIDSQGDTAPAKPTREEIASGIGADSDQLAAHAVPDAANTPDRSLQDWLTQLPAPTPGSQFLVDADGRLILTWVDRQGVRVNRSTDGLLVRGSQGAAPWLPDGWKMEVFPAGWTLCHLEGWFDHAINMAGLNHSSFPTPRDWVAHAHLIVRHLARHLGLPDAPSEPRGPMDDAGCLADLRDILGYFQRALGSATPVQVVGVQPPAPDREQTEADAIVHLRHAILREREVLTLMGGLQTGEANHASSLRRLFRLWETVLPHEPTPDWPADPSNPDQARAAVNAMLRTLNEIVPPPVNEMGTPERPVSRRACRVLAVLVQANGVLTQDEISSKITKPNMQRQTVSRAVKELRSRGLSQKVPGGGETITTAGRDYMSKAGT
jgi:hypothetical protein